MSTSPIYNITPITFRLDLKDPFIFTAHHIDHYPAGNAEMGPVHPAINQEFNMYYGSVVPGFPEHPHTGFELLLWWNKVMSTILIPWVMVDDMLQAMCNG